MIDKREILETASMLGLQPNVVEKDYVLGWVLAGVHANSELTDAWIFKGGTCLKKCYFETYRFSEDLDFTLRDEAHLDEAFLRRALGGVAEWVADESGLAVPTAEIGIDIYSNARGRPSCQGQDRLPWACLPHLRRLAEDQARPDGGRALGPACGAS